MAFETIDNVVTLINQMGLKIGNLFRSSTGGAATASTLPYIDANSLLQSGNIPFTIPMFAGVTDTSFSVMSIAGQSTGTANDLMHQTLVAAANVTTFTSGGFARVTITDNAGNITNGQYYVQFGTLT